MSSMPRPNSGYSDFYRSDADFASPTFSPPAEYNEFNSLRPGTPGTIGRMSVTDSLSTEKYDYPPRSDAPTPSPSTQGLLYADGGQRGSTRSSTYYFDKEAGAARPQPSYQNAGRRGPGYSAAVPASAAAAAAAAGKAFGAGKGGRGGVVGFAKRRPFLTTGLLLLLLAIIGVGAGVGISKGLDSSDQKTKDLSAQNGSGSGDKGSGSSSGTGAGSSSEPAKPKPIVPFPKWNWTDPNLKMHGVSLGSWMLLERWQLEDWMVQEGGNEAWDEYRFMQIVGKEKGAQLLQAHQDTWVTESDMNTLQAAGINTIRIPIPFWAFIPTTSDEPYATGPFYRNNLDKMLQWCYDRGMYVMLDLHGMPGSQNGDQSSGHNTTDVTWFEDNQQARSDQFVGAVLDWASKSNLSSIINSLGVVNEPRVVNDNWGLNQTKFDVTQSFYERSYTACVKAGIPMTFHHGFYPGQTIDKLNAWRGFATGKDPNFLIFEDHPYPGWFQTPLPGAEAIQEAVCAQGQAAVGYPVPVIIGEYSAVSNLNSTDYDRSYMNMQLATYGWSAGSIFWNFKVQTSQTQVLAQRDDIMRLYSFLDLYGAGIISAPARGQSVREWLMTLGNTCGNFQTFGWSNPSRTGAAFSGRRRRREAPLYRRGELSA